MQKIHFYLPLLTLLLSFNLINAQTYSYDFNTTTKTARIYTNNEVVLDFDVLTDEGFANNLKFEDGYIFEFQNDEWVNKGFFNKNEIIYEKVNYELKKNFSGHFSIKKEGNKKWSKIKFKKNKFTIEKNGNELPQTVVYLYLLQEVKNLCLNELERIRQKRMQERLEYQKKLNDKETSN